MTRNENYNGWKNRSTWNVSLWINNDEGLYNSACAYVRKYPNSRRPYGNFIRSEDLEQDRTPDGIKWLSTRLDFEALNDMMRELIA